MAKTIITISKTEQTSQYSPITITVTEEHDKLLDDEKKDTRMKKLGRQIEKAMAYEKKRWMKDE